MPKVKTLYDGSKWANIVRVDMTDVGLGMYDCLSAPWCDNTGVAILAYRKTDGGSEVLGRYEICPAHSYEAELCSITGGYDNSDKFSLVECALNELAEEGGYRASAEHMMVLGTIRPSKASMNTMYIFAVDVEQPGIVPCEAVGDGTIGEVGSYCKWVPVQDAILCKDPLVPTMISRLNVLWGVSL